jgi:RNA polymerase sigma-54 factor
MKPRLQTSMGQHLVLTPQLRQAIHLLQLSALELDAELAEAVETNPLLDWAEPEPIRTSTADDPAPPDGPDGDSFGSDDAAPWTRGEDAWQQRVGPSSDNEDDDSDASDRIAEPQTLQDHLQWQLHLTHLSPRDRRIGLTLIDAIDDDGYLREAFTALREAMLPDMVVTDDEVLAVLRQLQRFDPPGVGARNLGECLALQLAPLPADTPGK